MENNPIIVQSGGSTKYIVYGVLVLVAGVLGYFFLYKPWRDQQEVISNNNINPTTKTGKAKIMATKLRVAMQGWGTNEKLMYEVADQIRAEKISWNDVAKEYYAMYKRDLVKDVQSELNSKELVEFWRRVNPATLTPQQQTQYANAAAQAAMKKAVVSTNPTLSMFSWLW